MRLIKMFGLAAVAAVVAMAFVGATSASATDTLICPNNTKALAPNATECGVSPTQLHFLTVDPTGVKDAPARLVTPDVTVECQALILADRTSAALANPLVYSATITYSSCTPCTVKVIKQGTILVLKTAGAVPELSTVTGHGFVVNVSCFFGSLNCDYDAAGLVGHGLPGPGGDGKGHVTYNGNKVNAKEKLGGFIGCPAVSELFALFKSLTPTYIRS